jgi:hypothetical protein
MLMNADASIARISPLSATPLTPNHSSGCSINSESIRPKKERYMKSAPLAEESLPTAGGSISTGEMIAAGEKNTQSDGFEYWFTAKCPDAPAFRGDPLLAVEFVTALNWVLAVRPE